MRAFGDRSPWKVPCKACGKIFDVPWNRSFVKRKYCSVECRNSMAYSQKMALKNIPKNCKECGKEFFTDKWKPRRLYCGIVCRNSHLRKNPPKIEVSCNTCGKTIKRIKWEVNQKNYCGYECMGLDRRKDEPCANTYESVRTWLARFDRMTSCNRCHFDDEPGILVVHHKDRDRQNNKMDNLEVLCPNCHAIEHLEERKSGWKGHRSNHPVKIKLRMQTQEKRRAIASD
jgi:hypothetical protein